MTLEKPLKQVPASRNNPMSSTSGYCWSGIRGLSFGRFLKAKERRESGQNGDAVPEMQRERTNFSHPGQEGQRAAQLAAPCVSTATSSGYHVKLQFPRPRWLSGRRSRIPDRVPLRSTSRGLTVRGHVGTFSRPRHFLENVRFPDSSLVLPTV